MMNDPIAVPHDPHCLPPYFKRICWSAVFAGAVVGLGLAFLFNIFGLAIGLSAVTIHTDNSVAFAGGGFAGIIIAVIVSMLVAGYTAGYLGRKYCPQRNMGILYGFLAWSVCLLLSAAVTTHVSQHVNTYAQSMMGPTFSVSDNVNGVKAVPAAETPRSRGDKQQAVARVVVSPESLAYGAFLLFALFFIGAVSACIGGCWAMTCKRED